MWWITKSDLLSVGLCSGLVLIGGWLWLRLWYFRLVSNARNQICDRDGKIAPGSLPKMLIGNLAEVYDSENHLAAYHSFHRRFGEVVQIFWLWRHQVSISNYAIARQILVDNQRNYRKFPPNSILQKLFGKSILTIADSGNEWKERRLLLNEIFARKNISNFHDVFRIYSEKLAQKWLNSDEIDIYPDLLALFLDIIGQTTISRDFSALEGEADRFLDALKYIVDHSTQPAHQFASWWKYIPIPSNRQLHRAFQTVDEVLESAIVERQTEENYQSTDVLDLLLQDKNLSKKEIRDNLIAIIANGHETVATSVAFSLYLLAQNSEKLTRAQEEVDRIMTGGVLTVTSVDRLDYLNCVILETLRFAPPMAGLKRISCQADNLSGWSIPAKQVVGITLEPLHHNSEYFGDRAEEFHPERYLDRELAMVATAVKDSPKQCPFRRLLNPTQTKISLPLTFGDGARKCLGEHFAMYEMKVALATLIYHFDFQVASNFTAELELGKFGLFLTSFPKHGVKMLIKSRNH